RPKFDVRMGVALTIVIGGVGYALYRTAIALNVNRIVIPIPPEHHWWTILILVLGALQFALLEEIVVLGYLTTRLQQLGFRGTWREGGILPGPAVIIAATLRGSYHLYQG